MSRAEFIAGWVADLFFQGRAGEMARVTKSQAREVIAKGIADAEEAWPEFEREMARLAESVSAPKQGEGAA